MKALLTGHGLSIGLMGKEHSTEDCSLFLIALCALDLEGKTCFIQ